MELHFLYFPKTVKNFLWQSFALLCKEHLTWQAMKLSAGLLRSLGMLLSRKYECTWICWHREHKTRRQSGSVISLAHFKEETLGTISWIVWLVCSSSDWGAGRPYQVEGSTSPKLWYRQATWYKAATNQSLASLQSECRQLLPCWTLEIQDRIKQDKYVQIGCPVERQAVYDAGLKAKLLRTFHSSYNFSVLALTDILSYRIP